MKSSPRTALNPAPQTRGGIEFGIIADAIRTAMEPLGYRIHVNTNQRIVTLTEKGYVGGGESEVHVKVRTKVRG